MREGTSSQNLMKIEAKEMAMMPTARPAKVLTNGSPPPSLNGREYRGGTRGCQKKSAGLNQMQCIAARTQGQCCSRSLSKLLLS